MTQNKKQFVKALPYGEIELHGDDETYQCNAGAITAMKIHFLDGMEFKHVEGECKRVQTVDPRYILVVIIGYDHGDHYAERMIFAAPTEAEVETFRVQINQIRYAEPVSQLRSWIENAKRKLKVKP